MEKDIKIVPYQPKYQSAFRELNEEWIRKFFRMEKPAMGLYEKLGFKKIDGPPTPDDRCNIQMALDLKR